MKGLGKGIASLALACALAVGGFIGGLMLSGGPATAATSGTGTTATGTTVAATPSASASQKSDGTTRHPCPHPSSSPAAATSSSNNV